ncbi:MAG: alpha/beta hydrolase [Myxococcota bacterium]
MTATFASTTGPIAVRVALRRALRGPKYPTWGIAHEVLAETMQSEAKLLMSLDPSAIRRRIPTTPLMPSLRRRVRVSHRELAGRPAMVLQPREILAPDRPVLLYFHGGGYVFGSNQTHKDLMTRLAVDADLMCIGFDYRLAPECPFPSGLGDCRKALLALYEEGVAPKNVFIGGDSAGAALALSTLITMRDAGEPMPRGAVVLSPWVDLSCTGRSIEENATFDYLGTEVLRHFASMYLPEGISVRDPLASPLYADLQGLPPLFLQVGGAEGLRSEVERFAERAEEAGVDVTLEVWRGMTHAFQGLAVLVREGRHALRSAADWIDHLASGDPTSSES